MEDVCCKIKYFRTKKGLTLKDISNKTGLSISFLSQIERAKSSISVNSLKRISDALDIPITSFFSPKENKYLTKKCERQTFTVLEDGVKYTRLTGDFERRSMEPLLVEYPPGQLDEKGVIHSGEEFYYVIEGELVVEVDSIKHKLKGGDSIHFPSSKPHTIFNPTNTKAKVLSVVTPLIF